MKLLILNLLCSYVCLCQVHIASATSTPPQNNYTITKDDVTCVVMSAGLELVVPYKGKDSKEYTSIMLIPNNPRVDGTCGQQENVLNVYFNNSWRLTFNFSYASLSEDAYQMESIEVNYATNRAWFPNISIATVGKVHSFITTLPYGTNLASTNSSYKCQGQTNLALNGNITLNIYDLHYRAFGYDNSTWFSDKNIQLCEADEAPIPDSNMAVAVAVGIALSVMIALVVLLYFIITKTKGTKYGYV